MCEYLYPGATPFPSPFLGVLLFRPDYIYAGVKIPDESAAMDLARQDVSVAPRRISYKAKHSCCDAQFLLSRTTGDALCIFGARTGLVRAFTQSIDQAQDVLIRDA